MERVTGMNFFLSPSLFLFKVVRNKRKRKKEEKEREKEKIRPLVDDIKVSDECDVIIVIILLPSTFFLF